MNPPQNVGFRTPPKPAAGPSLSKAEKQRLLDNLELEVNDRTRSFNAALSDVLNSFLVRQESEILRIPKDLRNIKMKDLKSMWGGDWSSTLRTLKEETLKENVIKHPENERIEQVLAKGAEDRKRKRQDATSEMDVDAGPIKKTPRRENPNGAPAQPPASSIPTPLKKSFMSSSKSLRPLLPTSGSFASPFKRLASRTNLNMLSPLPRSPAPPPKTERSFFSRGNDSKTPIPTIKKFEPVIPDLTPKFPRQMKETDVVLSANGSPIANPWSTPAGKPRSQAYTQQLEEDRDDEDDELPDPEALEREMLSRSNVSRPLATGPLPRVLGKKRISSIRIRQSISTGQQGYYDPFVSSNPKAAPAPRPAAQQLENDSPARISSRGAMLRLTTSSGLTIDFDPFTDDPTMVEEELKGKGVDEDVREQVRREMAKKVQELRDRLASFKI